MDETFGDQVKRSLSGLSRKDVSFFAWLCAVRALPFLSVNGTFDHWKHKDRDKRQDYLLDVLRAIDTARIITQIDSRALIAAVNAYGNRFADAAASATYAAASAAYAHTYTDNTNAIQVAIRAAVHTSDATDVTHICEIDLRSILLEDLEIIKSGNCNFRNDTTMYGEIWDNFQGALRDVGCEYWGDWYAKLFAKGFILDDNDREEIKLRLNTPSEIVKQGAAEVARYVLKLKVQKKVEDLNLFTHDTSFSEGFFGSKYLVSASEDSSVKIWARENGKLIRTKKCHTSSVYCVCFRTCIK